LSTIKKKVLYWLKAYNTFSYLDNNEYNNKPNRFELLVGVGMQKEVAIHEIDLFSGAWIFGHINYDFKNQIYTKLASKNHPHINFTPTSFYIPDIVISIPFGKNIVEITSYNTDPESLYHVIMETNITDTQNYNIVAVENNTWQSDFSQETYIATVTQLQQHIIEGDCYEINLCNGNSVTVAHIHPYELFDTLNQKNPAPFAAFYRRENQFVISTSPERYLYKDNGTIISQPIKGTILRNKEHKQDILLQQQLRNDPKERAENVMITDLVRNDLAQLCKVGSIQVSELFGVYTFSSLHHLISTVQGKLVTTSLYKMLTTPFPMGSMTGAPKHIVMQLIEHFEKSARGIYSGTIGYITPAQDFDFNVVIRSIVFDANNNQLSFHTGGAITIDSNPQKEWQEICLKATRLKEIF
jgi:para-aminobenzoate synthetase component 1